MIQSLIQHKLQTSAGEVREEFVVHSTSWRFTPPDKVILTLKELRKINISTGQPRSRAGLERQVVAHAMRHISFLIKTDYANEFKDAFTPKTRKVFRSLWVSLAGRITF